jgi:hypothetical protein
MKKLPVLLIVLTIASCSTGKKESPDYADLLKIKEYIERGSGNAIRRYEEIAGPGHLADISTDPAFIALKEKALADVNNLIIQALENDEEKLAVLDCIRQFGADSPECAAHVTHVRSSTAPRLRQFDAEVSKFLVNRLDKVGGFSKETLNCQNVRIGIFQVIVEGDTMLISRDDDTQVELFRGEIRKEKVTWIDDCTYRLVVMREQSDSTRFQGPGGYIDDSFVEIIRVADDHYVYKLFDAIDNEEGELLDIGKVYVKK